MNVLGSNGGGGGLDEGILGIQLLGSPDGGLEKGGKFEGGKGGNCGNGGKGGN